MDSPPSVLAKVVQLLFIFGCILMICIVLQELTSLWVDFSILLLCQICVPLFRHVNEPLSPLAFVGQLNVEQLSIFGFTSSEDGISLIGGS